MFYDEPLYHHSSPSPLGKYSTRILLGLLCSLSTVLLLFHIPFSTSTVPIGWSTRPSARIPLSQVQHTEQIDAESEDQAPENEASAPPPTRHAPPSPSAAADRSPNESKGEQAKDQSQDASSSSNDRSPSVQSIATLSSKDTQPEIVGGRRTLYLNLTYPPAARKKGVEGLLMLQFTVGKEGNTRRIRVTKSLHPLCDSAAVRALRSVKFRPATKQGSPIPIRMSLPVRFELRSDSSALRTTRRTSPEGE